MLEHTSFTFNGKSSDDLGVMMVQSSGGLFEETFIPSRKINEDNIYKRKKRYFKGVETEPLSFSFSIWIKDWKNRKNLRAIARWLTTETYEPFWFNNEPDKVYYAIVEGESKLTHNGLQDGSFTVTFRCDSEYSYSQPIVYDFYVRGTESFQFFNEGDETIYPFMKITQRRNNQNIIIRNVTDNRIFTLSGVLLDEIIEVDCENEIIKSNREDGVRYLYDKHNKYWLPFEGERQRESYSSYAIELEGEFDIEMTFEYKYIQQGDGYY